MLDGDLRLLLRLERGDGVSRETIFSGKGIEWLVDDTRTHTLDLGAEEVDQLLLSGAVWDTLHAHLGHGRIATDLDLDTFLDTFLGLCISRPDLANWEERRAGTPQPNWAA